MKKFFLIYQFFFHGWCFGIRSLCPAIGCTYLSSPRPPGVLYVTPVFMCAVPLESLFGVLAGPLAGMSAPSLPRQKLPLTCDDGEETQHTASTPVLNPGCVYIKYRFDERAWLCMNKQFDVLCTAKGSEYSCLPTLMICLPLPSRKNRINNCPAPTFHLMTLKYETHVSPVTSDCGSWLALG